MAELARLYRVFWTVGDQGELVKLLLMMAYSTLQDWLTLLSWHRPHLFFTLPCQFNVLAYSGDSEQVRAPQP